MEKQCILDEVNSVALDCTQHSSSLVSLTNNHLLESPDLLIRNKPSTSRNSMSLLQDDEFANLQHAFEEELLDDETTTSGVLDTFEISSSNSLPLPSCSDTIETVAVDDSSSSDTIKVVSVSNPSSCNNGFFNSSEVYVINDDDDDDEEGDNASSASMSQLTSGIGHLDNQLNSVIMTAGGNTIYLETPVVEEQQHHQQIINLTTDHMEYTEKSGKPKRLSDELLFAEDTDADAIVEIVDDDTPLSNNNETIATTSSAAGYKFQVSESLGAENKYELNVDGNVELQHDRMSFRLKKMNINNSSIHDADMNATVSLNDMPSSSSLIIGAPTMADIESIDLIERRDFETEQRLTGGIVLKSSSLINKNMVNLNLIKSCINHHQNGMQQEQQEFDEEYPSSSRKNERAVSSDSKCAYKDPTTTPTSSRHFNGRLTKSTAKINLCSTLSHPQNQEQLQRTISGTPNASKSKLNQQKATAASSLSASTSTSTSTSTSSSSSSSSSVIVEAPIASTSANSLKGIDDVAGVEIFSNSNSNDSVIEESIETTASCKDKREKQPAFGQGIDGGCSRTNALHSVESRAIYIDDDAQPSTSSSARCQYAPQKTLRQINASAQTTERYVPHRTGIDCSSADNANNGNSNSGFQPASGTGVSAHSGKHRRRVDLMSTSHLNRNSTSEEVIAAFKEVVAAAAAERAEFISEDNWSGECEEINSDAEEVCTCHHTSSSSSSESSHGGSCTSLNETNDDIDVSTTHCSKDGDLSNYIQMVSISEEVNAHSASDCAASTSTVGIVHQQRKRKYNDGRQIESDYNVAVITNCTGGNSGDANSRKRIAYDFSSTPRSSQTNSRALALSSSSPSTHLVSLSMPGSSPLSRRSTTRSSIIPTRDNPPPELQNWLAQFQRWSHVERLVALNRLIEHCEPQQVRHMMEVIEPQFQRDFISLLPRELALQVLAYLEPKDLLRAAQTCRSWRFLCDDNLLWKEKCRKAQILTDEPRGHADRPKRGRAGNMPPIASPWKAAYMRQHIIEMNWRSRPIRDPKILKGHDDHVITCLQFSGNRIVSGSDDNTLKVWSAVTGRCLRTLVGHTGGVWSSQMSGNTIISGSTDRTLKVWDMESGHCVHTLMGHTSTVRCMHLHGNKVVSGSRDATLRVWDIDKGMCLHVLVGHLAAVRCVQYDGKLIVSGAYDYMVKIWHPERQECLHTLQGHTNRVYSLQFDGVHVVSGSLDTSIRVWDAETGNCKHTLMGHQSLTSGMELRQNILVSGNADSTVKVWDITTGQCLQTLSGPNKHQSAVTCLQFNSRFVVTSSDDGTVKLWDVKTGEFIRNLVALESGGSGGVVWRIRANDTKLICAVGSRNGTEETKLMVLDFDVEGACVKCS